MQTEEVQGRRGSSSRKSRTKKCIFFPSPSAVQHPSQITSFDFPVLAGTRHSEIGKRTAKGCSYSIVISVLLFGLRVRGMQFGQHLSLTVQKAPDLSAFPCADGRASCHSARVTSLPSKCTTDDAEVRAGRDTKEGERGIMGEKRSRGSSVI